MTDRAAEARARATEVWNRALDRRRDDVPAESELDAALAKVTRRGASSLLAADAVPLVLGSNELDEPEGLPDEIVVGWTPFDDTDDADGATNDHTGAPPEQGAVSGYDRLILTLLEAGFRPTAETRGGDFRVVRARRDGYRIRGYRLGDEEAIVDLYRDTFEDELSVRRWSWRYLDNPLGGPRISLAFSPSGDLVGHYCAYPMRWAGLPDAVPAVTHQVGDTMTRRDARGVGRGPTSLLARSSRHFYLSACRDRVAFNYGFHSGNIQKFSTRFLGSNVVEDTPYRELAPGARLGRSSGLGRPFGLGRRYRIRRLTDPAQIDAEFDDLFERVKERYGLLIERSSSYLRWRYLDQPEAEPRLLAAYRRDQLVGWIVVAQHDDRVDWGDALVDPDELPALRALLAEVRAPGLPIGGWFTDRPDWWSNELDALGFVRRPEPNGLVTVLVPFVCQDGVAHLRGGYYTKGDSDLF